MAKVVVFSLCGQLYGVDALQVRSIERVPELRAFPGSDRRVLGVVSIRGRVMPVVDLAVAIHIDTAPRAERQRLLIMESGGEEVAFAVETVRDVVDVDSGSAAPPRALAGDGAAFISGVLLWREEILVLLRSDRVLERTEAIELAALAGGGRE